jgi:uncharacterized membrane protein
MTVYLLALAIGIVAGLRAMTAPAAMSWAAHQGALRLGGTWLAFLGNVWTSWILTVLAPAFAEDAVAIGGALLIAAVLV